MEEKKRKRENGQNGLKSSSTSGDVLDMQMIKRAKMKSERGGGIDHPRPKGDQNEVFTVDTSEPSQDSDLFCAICFDYYCEPHMTRCGHTFCFDCLVKSLKERAVCPKCSDSLAGDNCYFPNHTVNDIIRRRKAKQSGQGQDQMSIEKMLSNNDMPITSISSLIEALQEKKELMEKENQTVQNQIVHRFLSKMRNQKGAEMDNLKRQLDTVDADLAIAERRIRDQHDATSAIVPSIQSEEAASSSSAALTRPPIFDINSAERKKRLDHHFDDLSKTYLERRCQLSTKFKFDDFSNTVAKFTQYDSLQAEATLQYSTDMFTQSSIVSSIDFDCDADYFAVAGVTKKIKIYDYQRVINRSINQVHSPSMEMTCQSKISCVAWNKYHKNKLASSEYDGSVSLWDAMTGKEVGQFREHEKRCWSVDFNSLDPEILASGSDDSKVRIWSMKCQKAVSTIGIKANVCCVQFNPHSSFHIAFGSADHCVHYYDIRRSDRELQVFQGHKKAVSYVKFLDANTLVSASTDSQLKMWKCGNDQVGRTFAESSFTGHQNEKNFVGLATDGEYIACGSEDNSLYLYYKGLQRPLIQYRFDVTRTILPESSGRGDEDSSEFLSAVAWRPRSSTLLAANSQGTIKLLTLR